MLEVYEREGGLGNYFFNRLFLCLIEGSPVRTKFFNFYLQPLTGTRGDPIVDKEQLGEDCLLG